MKKLPFFIFFFFFPSPLFAEDCYKLLFYQTGSHNSDFTYAHPGATFDQTTGVLSLNSPVLYQTLVTINHYQYAIVKKIENGWTYTTGGSFELLSGATVPGTYEQDFSNENLNAKYLTCGGDPCDTADSDDDGICNQCDLNQGNPDSPDILLGQSVDSSGNVTHVAIKRGGSGDIEHWTGDNYSSSDSFIGFIGGESTGNLNCAENCDLGMDNPCVYGSSAFSGVVTDLQPYTNTSLPGVDEQIEELLNLPDPEDLPERCDGHNAQCSEYCSDKLGVALSYCRDKEGQKVSDCQCNNDFAYNMVTGEPGETLQDKAESADLTKDSNSSGVPDYADDSILNQGDTDQDGITDKADVDQTGGQDSNGDGIDDQYTANAQASANASAGLSKADSLNLDSIATSTAQTSAATQGLKTGIDSVVTNTGDLLDKADAALAESQAIRQHLDGFSESNTNSLSDVEQTLTDGPFSGISEGDIPDDPTSQENFDIDAFVSEFSFAFPDEMKGLIEGSKLETSSPDSCIRGQVMGQQIEFCFDQFHSIFVALGVLFQGLCVFRAFGIVVGGFGR